MTTLTATQNTNLRKSIRHCGLRRLSHQGQLFYLHTYSSPNEFRKGSYLIVTKAQKTSEKSPDWRSFLSSEPYPNENMEETGVFWLRTASTKGGKVLSGMWMGHYANLKGVKPEEKRTENSPDAFMYIQEMTPLPAKPKAAPQATDDFTPEQGDPFSDTVSAPAVSVPMNPTDDLV